MTLRIVLAAAAGFAGSLAAQRPRTPVTPPPQDRITLQPPGPMDLVGSIVAVASAESLWHVVVENPGRMSVTRNVTVELYRGGSLVATKVFSEVPARSQVLFGTFRCWVPLTHQGATNVPPGQGGSPACPWPVGYGCTDSRIVVDAADAVAESNESNNKLEFCWKPPTTFLLNSDPQ